LRGMSREAYHPKAYLSKIRNVKLGLRARTRILSILDRHSVDTKGLAREAIMGYGVALHHLKLLEAEAVVKRKGNKPHVWAPTGVGQRRLVDSL